jgi:hypothetical protein
MASAMSHATIASEATAPAVILAFSFIRVVDDPCRMTSAGQSWAAASLADA